jgi:hypothetical protein
MPCDNDADDKLARLQRKLDSAQVHYATCTEPAKRVRIQQNVQELQQQLLLMQQSPAAAEKRRRSGGGGGEAAARRDNRGKVALSDAAAVPNVAAAHGLPQPRTVAAVDDAQVAVYRDLKDDRATARKGRCIVEGPECIKLLLRSELEVVSLFVKPTIFAKLAEVRPCSCSKSLWRLRWFVRFDVDDK